MPSAGVKNRIICQAEWFFVTRLRPVHDIFHGVKVPLDYSVFTAAEAAFALSLMKGKFLEIDSLATGHLKESKEMPLL